MELFYTALILISVGYISKIIQEYLADKVKADARLTLFVARAADALKQAEEEKALVQIIHERIPAQKELTETLRGKVSASQSLLAQEKTRRLRLEALANKEAFRRVVSRR